MGHVARTACMDALKGQEDDLLELLVSKTSVAEIAKSICRKSCKTKRKLPALNDWQDEEFKARDQAIVDQEDALPPGMQSYNANDILSMTESDQIAWFADQEKKRQLREMR